MKNKLGFTLIEMLVVVLIIGILAGIALPQYDRAVEKSRAAEAMIILKSMLNAQKECILTTGREDNEGCYGEEFWENSSFEPLAELTDNCLDTEPCFRTTHWEYWMDDLPYAGRVKNEKIIAAILLDDMYYCVPYEDLDYCKKIGM